MACKVSEKDRKDNTETYSRTNKNKGRTRVLKHTVGYRLKDEAMKALPQLLKQDFGIEVVGRLKREFIEISKNNYIEVNIFGEGRKKQRIYYFRRGKKAA